MIKVVRSNKCGEYEASLGGFCSYNGIIHQTTTLYSPKKNSIIEHKNQILKETMNAYVGNFKSTSQLIERNNFNYQLYTWNSTSQEVRTYII